MKNGTSPPEVLCLFDQNQKDEKLLQELEQHLYPLRRERRLVFHHRGQILPGENHEQTVQQWMVRASIILFLVSPDFLASDTCNREMRQAMQQQTARVIPVLLRPGNLHHTPFAKLTCLPSNGKAVTSWSDRDEAWKMVTDKIREVLDERQQSDTSGLPGQLDAGLVPSGSRVKKRTVAFILSCLVILAVIVGILGRTVYLSQFQGSSLAPTPTTGNTSGSLPSKTYPEQEGTLGSITFLNPYNLTGEGPKVEAGKWVQVSCKILAPTIPSASPGYWYLIVTSPWNNAYYAIANTFLNGDILGHRPYTHNVDNSVPNC